MRDAEHYDEFRVTGVFLLAIMSSWEQAAFMAVDQVSPAASRPPRARGHRTLADNPTQPDKHRGSPGPALNAYENLTHGLFGARIMAQKRKSQNNRNNGRRRRYSGSRPTSGDQEMAHNVSLITADAMRATADRVAENTMAAADIIHEQAEQLVEDLRQQSDLMRGRSKVFLADGSNW